MVFCRVGPVALGPLWCWVCHMIKPISLRLQLIVLAGLLAVAAGLWLARQEVGQAAAGLTGKSAEKRDKRGRALVPVPVIVEVVSPARNDEKISAVGTARARRSVMLHAKSDGQIIAFPAASGQRVKVGDVIFELDKTQAELAVELAQKRLEDAERLLARQEQLKRRRVASSAKVDDNRLIVERALIELRQAQKVLRDMSVTAPFAGVIGLPKAEVGDWVTTATPVVSLDMRTELLVEFTVAERYATRIKQGDTIEATTPGFGTRRFAGRIGDIDSRIDPTARTATLRAVIPNQDDLLRPGMSFVVMFVLPGKSYPSVPELALQWRKGESYVWVVRKQKAHKVLVRTVQRQNARVLIEGPVAAGDLVVIEGVQRLRPGRSVAYDRPTGRTPPTAAQKRRERSPVQGTKG